MIKNQDEPVYMIQIALPAPHDKLWDYRDHEDVSHLNNPGQTERLRYFQGHSSATGYKFRLIKKSIEVIA